MTKLTVVAAVVLVVTGCEKATTAPAPDDAKAFVGVWSCKSALTYRFTVPPGTPDKQASLETTRTFTGAGNALQATSVTASGYSSGCSMNWTVVGSTATEVPDEKCSATVTTPDGSVRTVTTTHSIATATLAGGTMHETGGADVDIVQGAVHLAGVGAATTTCTRKP